MFQVLIMVCQQIFRGWEMQNMKMTEEYVVRTEKHVLAWKRL